jgi:hypothetical protein
MVSMLTSDMVDHRVPGYLSYAQQHQWFNG